VTLASPCGLVLPALRVKTLTWYVPGVCRIHVNVLTLFQLFTALHC
jgi:hypothetical protein